MGKALDKIELAIRVRSHVRKVDGHYVRVDAHLREGDPAAVPKPITAPSPALRELPTLNWSPSNITSNSEAKAAIDALRAQMKDLAPSVLQVSSSTLWGTWLATTTVRDALKARAQMFDQVRKPEHKYPDLTKAGKILAGREWGRYDSLVRTSRLLSRMKSHSIDPKEAEAEYHDLMDNRLVVKVFGQDYPLPLDVIRASLVKEAEGYGIDTKKIKTIKDELPSIPDPAPNVPPASLLPGTFASEGWPGDDDYLTAGPGDQVWITEHAESPAKATAIAIKHPDGSVDVGWGVGGFEKEHHAPGSPFASKIGVPDTDMHYQLYGTVVGDVPEVPETQVPPLPISTPHGPIEPQLGDSVYKSEKTGTVILNKGEGGWVVYDAAEDLPVEVPKGHPKAKSLGLVVHKPPYVKVKEKGKPFGVKLMTPVEPPKPVTIDIPDTGTVELGPGDVAISHPSGPEQVGVRHPDGSWTGYFGGHVVEVAPGKELGGWEKTYQAMLKGEGGYKIIGHGPDYVPPEPEEPPEQPPELPTFDAPMGGGLTKVSLLPGDVVVGTPESADYQVAVKHADGSWTYYYGPNDPVPHLEQTNPSAVSTWEKMLAEGKVLAKGPPISTPSAAGGNKATLPGGATIKLKKGQSYYVSPSGNAVLIDPDKSVLVYKAGDNTPTSAHASFSDFAKAVVSEIMSGKGPWSYEAGVDLLTGEAPKKAKAKKSPKYDGPVLALDDDDMNLLASMSDGSTTGVDWFMKKYRKRWRHPWTVGYAKEKGYTQPGDFTEELRREALIDSIPDLSEAMGKMEGARQHTDPDLVLTPSQKAKLAQERLRYRTLLSLAELARDLDKMPAEDASSRLDALEPLFMDTDEFIFTKGSKSPELDKWPVASQQGLVRSLRTNVDQRLFEERKSQLPFDLDIADESELVAFITDKGGGDVAPWLSQEERRKWVRVWLRDPSILTEYPSSKYETDKYAYVLGEIQKDALPKAKFAKVMAMANLDLHVQPVPEGPDVDQQKAIAQQAINEAKRFEIRADLRKRYELSHQISTSQSQVTGAIRQLEDGTWEVWLAPYGGAVVDWHTVQESEVIDLLLSEPKWEIKDSTRADTAFSLDVKEAKPLLSMEPGHQTRKLQGAYIKQRGGSFVSKMTQPEREEWIRAHIARNNLLKYAIESKVAKKSISGKTVQEHTGKTEHPGSPESPAGKVSFQMLSDLSTISEWGESYRSGKPVSEWSPSEVVTFATIMRLDAPDYESGSIPEAVARERVSAFLYWLPGTDLPNPSPGFQAAVPLEPTPPPANKPDGVSDEAFDLVEAFKVVTPDQHAVAEFSPKADALSEEDADDIIKASAIGKKLKYQGLYDMPLPLKQAYLAKTNSAFDADPELPPDFGTYVLSLVESGVFDAPKPEGYYGVVSNGDTLYYLKPGDKVFEVGEWVPTPGEGATVTTAHGEIYALSPGDVALALKTSPDKVQAVRHLDGSWTAFPSGHSGGKTYPPDDSISQSWEDVVNLKTPAAEEFMIVASEGAIGTSGQYYGHKLEPGAKVYAAPTPAGTASLGGNVVVVLPDGSGYGITPEGSKFTQNKDQIAGAKAGWIDVTALAVKPKVAQGPPLPPKDEVKGYPLKPGDVVEIAPGYDLSQNVAVAVIHPDDTVTLLTESGQLWKTLGIASYKADHNWKPVATGPTATMTTQGHGPYVVKPGDKMWELFGDVYIKHADGSWTQVKASKSSSAEVELGEEIAHWPAAKTESPTEVANVLNSPTNEIYKHPVDPTDYPYVFTVPAQAGPAPPVGHGPYKIKPGDKVWKSTTAPKEIVYVEHPDGSWDRVATSKGKITSAFAPGDVMASYTPDSQGAKNLSDPSNAIYGHPVAAPGGEYPDAFTEVGVTAGSPPKSVLWVQHADGTGSWITASGVEPVTDAEVDGLASSSHLYVPLKPTSVPAKPIDTLEEAKSKGLADEVSQADWDSAAAVDALPEDWAPLDVLADDDAIRAALASAKETYGIEVSKAFIENAPMSAQRYMFSLVATKEKLPVIAVLNWKADHGHWGTKTGFPPFPQGKPYTPYLLAGMTSESDLSSWDFDALKTFQKDFGLSSNADHQEIAAKIDEVIHGPKSPVVHYNAAASAEPKKFKKNPNWVNEGGVHEKDGIIDQFGKEYMVKFYSNDPSGSPEMRVDAEVYANRLSNLHGFHAPPVEDPRVLQVEGWPNARYSYVQSYVSKSKKWGDMASRKAEDLPDDLLTELAEEHVLDWVISQHDSYFSNLFVSGDDQHIVGIDKGQAFKFFPNDKLAVGYQPSGNPYPVYYDTLYNAVISGKISKERADKIVLHLLQRAKRMQFAHDPEHRELLEKAFANRTSFPSGMTRESFIDALMERKHHAAEDFEKLWKGIYAQAGYEWDVPPLEELSVGEVEVGDRKVWSGTSPQFFESVERAQNHGQATMYAGTDLEDGHLLFYEEQNPQGGRTLVAEGKLRVEADKRLTKWLIDQKAMDGAVAPPTQNVYQLPGNETWYAALVAGAMTVNHHQDDGEYNAGTLATMANAKAEIEKQLAAIDVWAKEHPGVPHASVPDLEAQNKFIEMAQTYLTYIGEIETAKASQAKTPSKNYQKFIYVPKAKTEPIEEWGAQGYKLQKHDDGSWHLLDLATGEDEVISEADAQSKIESGAFTQASAAKAVTALEVKVYKRENSRAAGHYDFDKGVLTEGGHETHEGSAGHEFDVEIGSNIVIEYRPHNGAGIAHTQKGMFRIRVSNWTGDDSDLELAFQQLAAMGVDLTPADEDSLRLLYWRMFYGVMSNRTKLNPAAAAVKAKINNWYGANPSPSDAEELAFLQQAFAEWIGQERVEDADFMPHFGHFRLNDPDLTTGHPHWVRPDASLDDLKSSKGHHMPSHDLDYGGHAARRDIARSGGLYATEERLRFYGKFVTGGSSVPDQQRGSANFTFLRPDSHHGQIILVPDLYLRMNTYGYNQDHFGRTVSPDHRGSESYFHPSNMTAHTSELMVKNGQSVLDDFVVFWVSNAAERKEIIDWYAERGITEIRGVPVEERIVHGSQVSESYAQAIWKRELEWRALHRITVLAA